MTPEVPALASLARHRAAGILCGALEVRELGREVPALASLARHRDALIPASRPRGPRARFRSRGTATQ